MVTLEIVGAVRSITIVVDAGELAIGPGCVHVTELAKSCGRTVPSPQLEAVIVNEVPLDAFVVKVQPVAVPEFSKSPLARPVIDCDMFSSKLRAFRVLVGVL